MTEQIYRYELTEVVYKIDGVWNLEAPKIMVLCVTGRARKDKFQLPFRFADYEAANAFCDALEKELGLPLMRRDLVNALLPNHKAMSKLFMAGWSSALDDSLFPENETPENKAEWERGFNLGLAHLRVYRSAILNAQSDF